MERFWNQVYWHNSLRQWLAVIVILIAGFIIVRVFKHIIIKYLKRFSKTTKSEWDDFIILQFERSVLPVAYTLTLYIAFSSLHLPGNVEKILKAAMMVVVTYYVLRMLTAVVTEFIYSVIQTRENGSAKGKQARGLIIILNVVIWILGTIFLIDNFGYDVTTLIAGLGIGGIAIALAAQTILGDLFSYFVIFFDRPFEIGDFIIVDDKMGVVEYVGVKTTRIRTLGGEQLICSNTDLTNSRLHNYKRMERRRVVFKIGVTYQTSFDALKLIPIMIKQIIEQKEKVTFDRGHFAGFGDSSLDFEFVYFVESADYNFYMDQQQSIFLDIVDLFEKRQIEFAYPTQTLFIQPQQTPSVA